MPQHIQIVKLDKNRLVGADSVKQSAHPKDRRSGPEPVISVYPGVPPYGTPEFDAFVKALNEKLNQ